MQKLGYITVREVYKGQKNYKQSYSKYAGATYNSKSGSIPSKAFGNHNYIKKNYKTIRHETVDEF